MAQSKSILCFIETQTSDMRLFGVLRLILLKHEGEICMGTLRELGYEVKKANQLQKLMQAFGSSRVGAWFFSKSLHWPDRILFKLTNGRWTLPTLLAGLPVIMLTTTGAKTGKERTMPLLGVPIEGNIAIIGSNYGQKKTPGWVYNLEKNPSAVVSYQDQSATVTARLSEEEETDKIFELGGAFYPGYPKYRVRADHRVIRVFVLEIAT